MGGGGDGGGGGVLRSYVFRSLLALVAKRKSAAPKSESKKTETSRIRGQLLDRHRFFLLIATSKTQLTTSVLNPLSQKILMKRKVIALVSLAYSAIFSACLGKPSPDVQVEKQPASTNPKLFTA